MTAVTHRRYWQGPVSSSWKLQGRLGKGGREPTKRSRKTKACWSAGGREGLHCFVPRELVVGSKRRNEEVTMFKIFGWRRRVLSSKGGRDGNGNLKSLTQLLKNPRPNLFETSSFNMLHGSAQSFILKILLASFRLRWRILRFLSLDWPWLTYWQSQRFDSQFQHTKVFRKSFKKLIISYPERKTPKRILRGLILCLRET